MRNPSGKISRAMKERCVLSTSPSKSSLPVLMTTMRIEENVERPTPNVQC